MSASGNRRSIDLIREERWAELILAAQDMTQVLQLLNDLPAGNQDDQQSFMASYAIVTTYSRPFTKNNARVIHGKRWTQDFTDAERTLHDRVIRIRGSDIAHTWRAKGRVHIQITEIPRPGGTNPKPEIRYSVQMTYQGLMRSEMAMLPAMVTKIRAAIDLERTSEGAAILAARVTAGYTNWFTPGRLGKPSDTPK